MDIFAKNTKICLCKCVGIERHLRKRNMRNKDNNCKIVEYVAICFNKVSKTKLK